MHINYAQCHPSAFPFYCSSEFGHYASECSIQCNCPRKAYNPICGSDGIEYISPCYAGCSAVSIANNSVLVSHSHHNHILVWDSS